jgi:hypothetical protein
VEARVNYPEGIAGRIIFDGTKQNFSSARAVVHGVRDSNVVD